MARVCPRTMHTPEECWCPSHRSGDRDEDARRRIAGTARWEWKGGEARHIFVSSKEGGEVSLCNLRRAVPPEGMARVRSSLPEPTERCVQCRRTLLSRVPNARMRRYLLSRGVGHPSP